MKKVLLLLLTFFGMNEVKSQVRTPTLYVSGTVSSDEKMLVSVLGTKSIEGNVVSAELNGKKTEAKTDAKGHALLDFAAIGAGLTGSVVATIKSFDKNGNLIQTATTKVENSNTQTAARPQIETLPKNLPNGEAVTIPGQHLGADARLFCGDQVQETLSASDKEMTVFTQALTGEQKAYVITPNGVSESQMVNFYSLDFSLPKSSISPKENVQALVHYESLPEGTKLVFTNQSPEIINMKIPGAASAGNEGIYIVKEKNGSFPVNITGIKRGNFKIGLDFDFAENPEDATKDKPHSTGILCLDFINTMLSALKERNAINATHPLMNPEDMEKDCRYWMCSKCGKQWTCFANFCPACFAMGKGKIPGIKGPDVKSVIPPSQPITVASLNCTDFINAFSGSLVSTGALPLLYANLNLDNKTDMEEKCSAWKCGKCGKIWTCYYNFCIKCFYKKETEGQKIKGTKLCSERCDYIDDRPTPPQRCTGVCIRPNPHGGNHSCGFPGH